MASLVTSTFAGTTEVLLSGKFSNIHICRHSGRSCSTSNTWRMSSGATWHMGRCATWHMSSGASTFSDHVNDVGHRKHAVCCKNATSVTDQVKVVAHWKNAVFCNSVTDHVNVVAHWKRDVCCQSATSVTDHVNVVAHWNHAVFCHECHRSCKCCGKQETCCVLQECHNCQRSGLAAPS